MSTFALKRGGGGRNALRRRAHLSHFNALGKVTGAWCGRPVNMTSNVPFGLRVCKDCVRLRDQMMQVES